MKKWFKLLGVSAVVVLVIAAIAGVAVAQGPLDEDGDGVCDVCGEQAGEGVMRGWRYNQGGETEWSGRRGPAGGEIPCDEFVDEDGDGVCDLCGGAEGAPMRGPGTDQRVQPQWQVHGPSANGEQVCDDFVDEDGDGVCDNHAEIPLRPFTGRGGQGRMGGGPTQNRPGKL